VAQDDRVHVRAIDDEVLLTPDIVHSFYHFFLRAVPSEIADRYTNSDQFERFDAAARKVLSGSHA
jgi:hypothetical protein